MATYVHPGSLGSANEQNPAICILETDLIHQNPPEFDSWVPDGKREK